MVNNWFLPITFWLSLLWLKFFLWMENNFFSVPLTFGNWHKVVIDWSMILVREHEFSCWSVWYSVKGTVRSTIPYVSLASFSQKNIICEYTFLFNYFLFIFQLFISFRKPVKKNWIRSTAILNSDLYIALKWEVYTMTQYVKGREVTLSCSYRSTGFKML